MPSSFRRSASKALLTYVCKKCDESETYRDGKWIMFEPKYESKFDDYMKLLAVKKSQIANDGFWFGGGTVVKINAVGNVSSKFKNI